MSGDLYIDFLTLYRMGAAILESLDAAAIRLLQHITPVSPFRALADTLSACFLSRFTACLTLLHKVSALHHYVHNFCS